MLDDTWKLLPTTQYKIRKNKKKAKSEDQYSYIFIVACEAKHKQSVLILSGFTIWKQQIFNQISTTPH